MEISKVQLEQMAKRLIAYADQIEKTGKEKNTQKC